MKLKNAFWLSLALATSFACAPLMAQTVPPDGAQPPPPGRGTPHQPPPPPHLNANEMDAQRTIPGAYRLAYTLTELDGSKRITSHRYEMVLDADGPPTDLKLGTKIPIETSASMSNLPPQTQIEYIDIGISIRSHLRRFANGLQLGSRVVQSAVEAQQPLTKTPVIRESSLESTVLLNENKPVILGDVDTPGGTHSLQVQVELSRVR